MNLAHIKDNFEELKGKISAAAKSAGREPAEIKLIAVSKNFPSEQIDFLNKLGQIDFGENKVQELISKAQSLSSNNINWHLIGHLQRNKVKQAVESSSMIQSVDNLRLAETIQQNCENIEKVIDVLVQVNTSGEAQKSGCNPLETMKLCEDISKFPNLRLRGLMTIGKFTEDEKEIRSNFRTLKKQFEDVSNSVKKLDFLSMGMTSDFGIAIEEGSNMLRIGSAIFGERDYI